MLNLYDYRGFVLVVGANGRTLVHLNDGNGMPGNLIADCKTRDLAMTWCDSPITDHVYPIKADGSRDVS